MTNTTFEEIITDVEHTTAEREFIRSHTAEELVGCESLDEVVTVKDVIFSGERVNLLVEKDEDEIKVITDKNDINYFNHIKEKVVYFSGLKKERDGKKYWFIRSHRDVTDNEQSIILCDKLTEAEKCVFQKKLEKFSPEIQRDLTHKKIEILSKTTECTEESSKALYKDEEELNALYDVLKSIIPPSFRQVYEDAKYRLEKNKATSEKRNLVKQMAEILDFDWMSNADYKEIDIEFLKKRIKEIHIGHDKQLDDIYTEFKASNISKKAPKTLNFIGRPGTGVNKLAEEIAKNLGRSYAVINLSGLIMKETEPLLGTSKIYDNCTTGFIFQKLQEAGTRGAIIIEDYDLYDSDIKNAILPLIKKSTFTDKFAEVEIDLSENIIILTCSDIKDIPMSIRANMISFYFQDLTEDEIFETINKIIVPKHCKEYNLEFTKEIPPLICRKFIYKFSNYDMNMLDNVLRTIVVKNVAKGETEFPDYTTKDIEELSFSKEDYEKIKNNYVRAITAVEHKFFSCYEEYPLKVQKRILELLEILNLGTDENEMSYARDCIHYLVNIFQADIEHFEIGTIINELMKEHYILSDFGERIEVAILSKKLQKNSDKMTIIGLKGAAGTGKSATAKSIAKAIKRGCVKINVGGSGGAEIIKGINKSFHNAAPSMLIKELSRTGNGSYADVIILDEIDKGTPDFYNALYEFLDPNESCIYDNYLECDIPKNNFCIICTFNDISCIPLPIRDRMEVVEYPSYSREDKKTIISQYILPKIEKKYSVNKIEIESDTLMFYLNNYDVTPGMRDVERDFEHVVLSIIRKNNGVIEENIKITSKNIKDYLGKTKSLGLNDIPNLAFGKSGMAQALAVTSGGVGVSTAVETIVNPYQEKNIIVTGLLEGSCLESVSLACCYSSNYLERELPKLHIHMTDPVKKDGPSAGVAITMSILSCLTNKPLPNVAYTGSVDLYGNIGPVGGVFEKLCAAERANIEKVYVPSICYKDLVDSKCLSRLKVEVIPVDTINDVIGYVWGNEMSSEIKMEVTKC